MSRANDPAHPTVADPSEAAFNGLTVLEYFAARAPAEPQPWFDPVMPPKPPSTPSWHTELPKDLHGQWQGLGDWLGDSQVDPRVLEFREKWSAALAAQTAWDREHQRQRLIQWPWALASAVLASRVQP